MIDIRRLHASEFDLLRTIDDGFTPDPEKSIAMVAKNSRRYAGRLFVVSPAHVEGIYVEPEYRGGTVFKDLMAATEIEAKSEGISKLFAYSVRPEIEHYLIRRCGYERLPWTVLAKELT